jgi:hypothetical protein
MVPFLASQVFIFSGALKVVPAYFLDRIYRIIRIFYDSSLSRRK